MSEKSSKFRFRDSISFKLIIIGALILLLMIPSIMVESLINERMHRKNTVMNEITSSWSNPQTLTGPIIALPYNEYYKNKEGEVKSKLKTAYILPETLDVEGDLKPEIRYRSIYKAVVYNADLQLNGRFDLSVLQSLRIDPKDLRLDEAELILGISDMRGITQDIALEIDQKNLMFEPGLSTGGRTKVSHGAEYAVIAAADAVKSLAHNLKPGGQLSFGPNVRSSLKLRNLPKRLDFSIKINLNGSKSFSVVPTGKTTNAKIRSDWNDPSFFGSFLPDTRDITDDNFSARWKVLHLNRPFPQAWTSSDQANLHGTEFGVKLLMTNDKYQKVSRTEKYGLMFIVFTFLAFFMSEVINKIKVHPVQYLFVGMGLIIFYSLLLAFSEHITFIKSYIIAAIATVFMITSYSRSVLKKTKLAMFVGLILTVLYLYLFVLLHMQDFALLMGSIGLFAVLGGVMYITRNIDWYGEPGTENLQ